MTLPREGPGPAFTADTGAGVAASPQTFTPEWPEDERTDAPPADTFPQEFSDDDPVDAWRAETASAKAAITAAGATLAGLQALTAAARHLRQDTLLEQDEIVDRLHAAADVVGLIDMFTEGVCLAAIGKGFAIGLGVEDRSRAGRQNDAELSFADASSWESRDLQPRQWLIRDRIPMAAVTLLTGDGAAGKTTIAMQLLAATALNHDWLGAAVTTPGCADFLTAEEDEAEIHRRLTSVLASRGKSFRDLEADQLRIHCRPERESTLGEPDSRGVIRPTKLFAQLEDELCRRRPVLFVVEALADIYAGNENDRTQVRQFGGLLRRLAISSGAAVLALGHPSLTGMSSGTGLSGSTHWNNSARSRLYFAGGGRAQDDEPAEPDVRELRVMKSNYGPAGEKIRVRWERGVFEPLGAMSTIEKAAAEADIDEAFLHCLDVRTAQGIEVGPNTGKNYAPAAFEGMVEAKRYNRRAFAAALERLLNAKRIKRAHV